MKPILRNAVCALADARDFLAFKVVIALPLDWPPVFALLPYAGCWAYRDEPASVEAREHWIKTGEQLP